MTVQELIYALSTEDPSAHVKLFSVEHFDEYEVFEVEEDEGDVLIKF